VRKIYILVYPSVTYPHLPPQVDPLHDSDIYADLGGYQGGLVSAVEGERPSGRGRKTGEGGTQGGGT
jgi:hypothetical protein